MRVDGKTKITGIFGYPVEHTLSPFIHNSGFEYLGLNFIYVPFRVHPDDLGKAVASLRVLNIAGVNVTVPHKERVLKYLDEISSDAKKIGAVNTVVNKNGKLKGYNTDASGFLKSLKEHIEPAGKQVVLLGCGGAGKSIAVSLASSKIKEIFLYDIDLKKSEKLSKKILSFNVKSQIIKNYESLEKVVSFCDILVNATTVGMRENDNPLIRPEWLNRKTFVYDIIYNCKTELIKLAEKIGCKCTGGLDMLLYQAVESFELWTGKKAPVEVMRNALVSALKL